MGTVRGSPVSSSSYILDLLPKKLSKGSKPPEEGEFFKPSFPKRSYLDRLESSDKTS